MGQKVIQATKRKTSDLFIVKRLLAQAINKLQKFLLTRQEQLAFKAYYKLAAIHFKLHYGFSLDAAMQCTRSPHCASMVKVALDYAAKRHVRLFLSVNPDIKNEGGKTLKYYSDSAYNAFLFNIKK